MQEILNAVQTVFASVPGLIAATLVVSEYFTRFTHAEGFKAQLQAWACAIALCFLGSGFDMGIFSDTGTLQWYFEAPVAGILVGLAANGIFNVPGVTSILEMIKVRPKQEPPTP